MKPVTGKYIVVEGPNGCGKEIVVSHLHEKIFPDAIMLREPDFASPSGRIIQYTRKNKSTDMSALLEKIRQESSNSDEAEKQRLDKLVNEIESERIRSLEHAIVILFAINRTPIMDEIKKLKSLGKTVISNRSFFSSIGVKSQYVEMEKIVEANTHAVGPDILIVVTADLETIMNRVKTRRAVGRHDSLEEIRHQCETYNKIPEIVRNFPLESMKPGKICFIDNSGTQEKTIEQVDKVFKFSPALRRC